MTLCSVPRLVVTVMPAEGSASTVPLAGAILTGPVGAALTTTGAALPLAAGRVVGAAGAWEFLCPLPEHPDASTARAAIVATRVDLLGSLLASPCPTRVVILSSTPIPAPAPRKSLPHPPYSYRAGSPKRSWVLGERNGADRTRWTRRRWGGAVIVWDAGSLTPRTTRPSA